MNKASALANRAVRRLLPGAPGGVARTIQTGIGSADDPMCKLNQVPRLLIPSNSVPLHFPSPADLHQPKPRRLVAL